MGLHGTTPVQQRVQDAAADAPGYVLRQMVAQEVRSSQLRRLLQRFFGARGEGDASLGDRDLAHPLLARSDGDPQAGAQTLVTVEAGHARAGRPTLYTPSNWKRRIHESGVRRPRMVSRRTSSTSSSRLG